MRKLALFAAFALCAAACSGDDDSSSDTASADAFLGKWSCSRTGNLTFTSPAGLPDQTLSTTTTLVFYAPSYGVLQGTESNGDSGPSCNINFHTLSASTAGLDTGLSCTDSTGLSVTFTGGSAVSGGASKLNVSLNFSFSGQLANDAGTSAAVSGTGTFAYVCAPTS